MRDAQGNPIFYQSEEEIKANKALLEEHLATIDDVELLVIKGHLLLEYAINKFIDDLAVPNRRTDIRFSFAQKFHIARLFDDGWLQVIEEDIVLFNRLRNGIAHSLHADLSILDSLRKRNVKYLPGVDTMALHQAIKSIVTFLFSSIMEASYGCRKLKAHQGHWDVLKGKWDNT